MKVFFVYILKIISIKLYLKLTIIHILNVKQTNNQIVQVIILKY